MCKNQLLCIHNQWKCDGDADCTDASDEDELMCTNATEQEIYEESEHEAESEAEPEFINLAEYMSADILGSGEHYSVLKYSSILTCNQAMILPVPGGMLGCGIFTKIMNGIRFEDTKYV